MEAAGAPVDLEEVGFPGSFRVLVRVGGEEITKLPVMRRQFCCAERYQQIWKYLLTPSSWPPDGHRWDAEAWHKTWAAAKALWTHPRKVKGSVSNRMVHATSRSTRWKGELSMVDMKLNGFTVVKHDSESEMEEEDCETLRAAVVAASGKMVVHASDDASTGVLSVLLLDEQTAAESRAEMARETGRGRLPEGSMAATGQVLEALLRQRRRLVQRAGMPAEVKPWHEGLTNGPGLHPPQRWHSDNTGPHVLAAVTGLSKEWVPPSFPSITKGWGPGMEDRIEGVTAATQEEKSDRLQMLSARERRWRRVYAGGSNTCDLATENGSGAELGQTATGMASAIPRKTMFGDPSRRRGGSRPTLRRGDTVFFDATGPHRGPGVALGEAPQRRTVLYTSWTARQDAKDGGAPAYAFATTKGGGNRVFDAKGKYLLQAEEVRTKAKREKEELLEAAAVLAAGPSAGGKPAAKRARKTPA